MLTKSTDWPIILVLITSFIGSSDLVRAQSRDSNPQPIPRLDTYEAESVRNEFLSRLKDYRSIAFRKDLIIKQYAKLTKTLTEFQQKNEKIEVELEALRSQYEPAATIPKTVAYRVSDLDSQRDQLYRLIKSVGFQVDLLVEEYDVLSRLEEIEKGFKTKSIPKADHIIEERRAKEELSQLRIARQLDQLEWQLSQSLSRIEKKLQR